MNMDSTGPIPFRASAAYGVRPTAPAGRPIAATTATGAGSAIRPTVSNIPGGTHLPTRPQAVNEGPMHLYNRQADRIEAATGVALGRTLDIQG